MPPRRIFRRKQPTQPMTEFRWRFFLAQSVADFDHLAAAEGADGSEFFMLYYDDGWRDVYAQHQAEIEAAWRTRHWTRQQKHFVMTPYLERGLTLAHDARSEQEAELWREFQANEGWKTSESFAEYRDRRMREEEHKWNTRKL
jgi:hypothetical protein